MKKLNKFIAFVATAILCFAMFAFAGCNKAEAYTFTVKNADGTAATGVEIQLCNMNENGVCDMPVSVDENGKAEVVPTWGEGEFEIHVLKNNNQVEFEGAEKTPATFDEIEITLK